MSVPFDTSGRSRFLDLEGSRRHVREWGEPGAPVVLLQHGLLDHAGSWCWIAASLGDRFHVVAPDLRGHGDSDWSRDRNYTLACYLLDLAETVETLGLTDINLVGHSLGGHVVLRYAASYPERIRSQVLIEGVELPVVRRQRKDPMPFPSRMREWVGEELARRRRNERFYADVEALQQRMAEAHPRIDRETTDYLARTGAIEVPARGWRWKYDNAVRGRAPEDPHGVDLDEILEAVTCPSLLAYGDESWIAPPPPERLALLRHHRVQRFAGASHWLHHQCRDQFIALLGEFLERPTETLNSENLLHA